MKKIASFHQSIFMKGRQWCEYDVGGFPCQYSVARKKHEMGIEGVQGSEIVNHTSQNIRSE